MRILLPIGKTGLPLDIAEEKIPDILEKVIPSAMKHMGTLKDMGIDINPMIRRFFGASEPVVTTVASETPATVSAASEIEKAKAAGYWQSDVDGKWYPPHLAPKVDQVKEQPLLKMCSTCIRGNNATNQPLSPFNPPCSTCQFDATRPSFMQV